MNISDGVSSLPNFGPVRHCILKRQRVIPTVKFDDLVGEGFGGLSNTVESTPSVRFANFVPL